MRNITSIFIIIFLNIQIGFGQIWPGDVNQNGIVNNLDLLYIGNAYGKVGPSRLNASTEWVEQSINAEWNDFFIGGINLAHADCNGDGIIDFLDFYVVYTNYDKTHGQVKTDHFVNGVPITDPTLLLNTIENNVIKEGQTLDIPISLGNETNLITNFNGISFSIYYDPELVKSSTLQFNIDDSWISENDNIFSVIQNDADKGIADVTVTRYGQDPVTGSGTIGTLSIIIEDDILAFGSQQEGTIAIDSIRMVDHFLNTTTIANDTITYTIIDKDSTTSIQKVDLENKIICFPNPASDIIYIQTDGIKMQTLEVYNLLGELVFTDDFNQNNHGQIHVNSYSAGIYVIKLFTNKGVLTKKLLVQNHKLH